MWKAQVSICSPGSLGINILSCHGYLVKYLVIDSGSRGKPFTLMLGPNNPVFLDCVSLEVDFFDYGADYLWLWISTRAENRTKTPWTSFFKWDVEGQAREGNEMTIRTFSLWSVSNIWSSLQIIINIIIVVTPSPWSLILDQDHLQYHPVIVITSVRVSNRQLEKAGLDIEDWMYVVNKGGVEVITMMIMMIMIQSSKLPLLIAQLMIFVLSFGFLYFQIQATEKYSSAMC